MVEENPLRPSERTLSDQDPGLFSLTLTEVSVGLKVLEGGWDLEFDCFGQTIL